MDIAISIDAEEIARLEPTEAVVDGARRYVSGDLTLYASAEGLRAAAERLLALAG